MTYNDIPEYKPVPCCPVCGSDSYDLVYFDDDHVIGCNDCIRALDAADWWDTIEETSQPDSDMEYHSRFD